MCNLSAAVRLYTPWCTADVPSSASTYTAILLCIDLYTYYTSLKFEIKYHQQNLFMCELFEARCANYSQLFQCVNYLNYSAKNMKNV